PVLQHRKRTLRVAGIAGAHVGRGHGQQVVMAAQMSRPLIIVSGGSSPVRRGAELLEGMAAEKGNLASQEGVRLCTDRFGLALQQPGQSFLGERAVFTQWSDQERYQLATLRPQYRGI